MTKNNKLPFILGGAIVVASVIAYLNYSNKQNKLDLVDNARVTEDETPTPEGVKPNPFTAMVNNPLPTSIDFKPRDLNTFL
jgi:hypothetical protein